MFTTVIALHCTLCIYCFYNYPLLYIVLLLNLLLPLDLIYIFAMCVFCSDALHKVFFSNKHPEPWI